MRGEKRYENQCYFQSHFNSHGISTLVLNIIGDVFVNTSITLLAIGVTCLLIIQLQDR